MFMRRRITTNKNRILTLFKKHHLLSAREICIKLGDIDKSIVYRNLKKFTDDGVLQQVSTDEGLKYEMNHDNHQHFFCTECGDILRIDIGIDRLKHSLPEGARASSWEVSVKGVCGECTGANGRD